MPFCLSVMTEKLVTSEPVPEVVGMATSLAFWPSFGNLNARLRMSRKRWRRPSKLGAECHIPHGRANAILLPYVIKYNATKPTKFASFPKYKEYVADERYAKIARRVGLCSADTPISEAVDCLVKAIRELMTVTERPLCIKDCGVREAEFMSKVDELSYKAFEDQCTTANPVYPLVSEIKELYREAYYG